MYAIRVFKEAVFGFVGFVLFRLAFVADATDPRRPECRDWIVPSSVPLGEGPDFEKPAQKAKV